MSGRSATARSTVSRAFCHSSFAMCALAHAYQARWLPAHVVVALWHAVIAASNWRATIDLLHALSWPTEVSRVAPLTARRSGALVTTSMSGSAGGSGSVL